MTRPDLEALAKAECDRTDFQCGNYRRSDLDRFAERVAAHERARWVAILREKAVAACAMSPQPVAGIDMLNAIADDLEADRE